MPPIEAHLPRQRLNAQIETPKLEQSHEQQATTISNKKTHDVDRQRPQFDV
jgi:hypothetical protein